MRKFVLMTLLAAASLTPSIAMAQDREWHGRVPTDHNGGAPRPDGGARPGGDRGRPDGGFVRPQAVSQQPVNVQPPAPRPQFQPPQQQFQAPRQQPQFQAPVATARPQGSPNQAWNGRGDGNRHDGDRRDGDRRWDGGNRGPQPQSQLQGQFQGQAQTQQGWRGTTDVQRGRDGWPGDNRWQEGREGARGYYNNGRGAYADRDGDRDRGRWNNNWHNDRRYDWRDYRSANRNLFHLPRYYAPYGYGYGYQRFGIGVRLNALLFSQSYWIDDPYDYRLPDVYGPYRWVRYYNDALLVDIYTGQVVDVAYDIFW